MLPYIIVVVSFILDGIISNFLPFMVGDLSIFTPLLTLVSLFIVSLFFVRYEKKYYLLCFITGIVYDLFYTNLLFYNGLIFLLIGFITIKVCKNIKIDYLKLIIYIIGLIILYELLNALLIVVFNVVYISFDKLLYKILHSLLLNIIYGEIIYLIINLLPKKYKRKILN